MDRGIARQIHPHHFPPITREVLLKLAEFGVQFGGIRLVHHEDGFATIVPERNFDPRVNVAVAMNRRVDLADLIFVGDADWTLLST